MLVTLNGQIERITYNDEESGYTVARLKVRGQPDLVTVTGNLMAPAPGEILKMHGEWQNHPRYGRQFRVVSYQTTMPATEYGIRKYLGSGLIKGIGPVMAGRIVTKFGTATLEIIEKQIENLVQVEGIGPKRVDMIARAWEEQREIRNVMLFLQSHGVGSGYAVKIFKYYGQHAITAVQENPYRLATDIHGIGFITADRIAESLGFDKTSEPRVRAGILYVLQKLSDEGHIYYPYENLIQKSREILDVSREIVVTALSALTLSERIIIEDLNTDLETFKPNHKAVFLVPQHVCECGIARRITRLMQTMHTHRPVDAVKALHWVQGQLNFRLASKQKEAIQRALDAKVLVITGGPGTGKTTIIKAVLQIFDRLGARILLAAPTGRAAKRMGETAGKEARTIHRLLEFSPSKGGFQKNSDHLLPCDLLIIDEVSMVDNTLMHHLLKAVPRHATLILVGDVNQLPSVGPGQVLGDMIASATIPVVRLNQIFRQARESRIIVNAHRINSGRMPQLTHRDEQSDFFFIERETPEETLELILQLVQKRIPAKFGLNPMVDIQVLTPMHRGVAGAGNLNLRLQETLNPGQGGIQRGGTAYRNGDKVMQTRNNYDKEVFNGDIGTITAIRPEELELEITFDGPPVVYEFSELDEVVLAYAVSVHKSQGSEYPVVVMPVLTQHYVLLQRNLIYTAVTRGKQLVVLVGSRKALAMGVKNDKTTQRYTRLRSRLYRYLQPTMAEHRDNTL